MCRLTKKQTQQLRTAIEHLRRGHKFVHDDEVVVGRVSSSTTATQPLLIDDAVSTKRIQPIDKYSGDMNGFDFALRHLQAFIEAHGFEEQRPRSPVMLHDTL